MTAKKVAVIMTGWQAVQFAIINHNNKKEFRFVLVAGAWERKILGGFSTIEMKSFDKYGRIVIKKICLLKRQISTLFNDIGYPIELWRPDIAGHVVEYLSGFSLVKTIVLLEDGIGSIAVKKPLLKKIKDFSKIKLFIFLMGRFPFWINKRKKSYAILEGVSYNMAGQHDIVVPASIYLVSAFQIGKSISGEIKIDSSEVLVLTQPISEMNYTTLAEEIEMQNQLLKNIEAQVGKILKIAVKPHPGENDAYSEKRVDAFRKAGLNVSVINRVVPVELLILSSPDKPILLASYCSSALPNVKSIFPDLNCLAYLAPPLLPYVDEKIKSHFKESGINVFE